MGGRQDSTQEAGRRATQDQAGYNPTARHQATIHKVRQDREDFSTLGLGCSVSMVRWVTPWIWYGVARKGNPRVAIIDSS